MFTAKTKGFLWSLVYQNNTIAFCVLPIGVKYIHLNNVPIVNRSINNECKCSHSWAFWNEEADDTNEPNV